MTTFFADVRVYRLPDHHYAIVSVEFGADSLVDGVRVLQAWQAGLRVHPNFDSGMEESIYGTKRRNVDYYTLREASVYLSTNLLEGNNTRD